MLKSSKLHFQALKKANKQQSNTFLRKIRDLVMVSQLHFSKSKETRGNTNYPSSVPSHIPKFYIL